MKNGPRKIGYDLDHHDTLIILMFEYFKDAHRSITRPRVANFKKKQRKALLEIMECITLRRSILNAYCKHQHRSIPSIDVSTLSQAEQHEVLTELANLYSLETERWVAASLQIHAGNCVYLLRKMFELCSRRRKTLVEDTLAIKSEAHSQKYLAKRERKRIKQRITDQRKRDERNAAKLEGGKPIQPICGSLSKHGMSLWVYTYLSRIFHILARQHDISQLSVKPPDL